MAHAFKRGWFSELSPNDDMWPGQALSLEVKDAPSPAPALLHLVALATSPACRPSS